MATVFLSYARVDLEIARLVAKALEDAGYSVFWDQALLAGDDWEAQIRTELDAAKVAVVLWSRASIASSAVRHEANIALGRNIVAPASIDGLHPNDTPFGFFTRQFAELEGFNGNPHPGMSKLLASVAAIVEGRAPSIKVPEPAPPSTRKNLASAIVGGTLASLVVAAGIFGYLRFAELGATTNQLQPSPPRAIDSTFSIPEADSSSPKSNGRKTLPAPEVKFSVGNGGKFSIKLSRLPKGRAHYSLDGATYQQFMTSTWTEFSEWPADRVVHLKFISEDGEEGPFSFPFDAGGLNRAAINKYGDEHSQNYIRARSVGPNPAFDLFASITDSSATFVAAAPRQPAQCQIRYESDFWETYPASTNFPWGCIIPRTSELFSKYTHRSPVHVRLIYEGGEKTSETSFNVDLAALVRRRGVHGAFDGSSALRCSEGRVLTGAPNRAGMISPSDYTTLARCEPSSSWKNIRSVDFGTTPNLGRSIDTGDNSVAIVRAISGQDNNTPRSGRMKDCSEGRASAGCLPFPLGTDEMYARFRLQDGTLTEVYRFRFSGG